MIRTLISTHMKSINNKKLENFIYYGFWFIAIILSLLEIMQARTYTDLPLLDAAVVIKFLLGLLPFMLLFAINNYLLIPILLKRGHYGKYFACAICSIAVIWIWQQFQFFNLSNFAPKPNAHGFPPHPGPRPLLPLPIFLDLIYDILIVGTNLAVSLIFQQFADRLKHESLMKENAENQLIYLKAQINPHFYMNMLNNIHGMIDINPEKAQEMVIEMSSLMRYMLYDSSRPETALSSEIKFIEDYLAIMRVRYPEDIVSIYAQLPDAKEMANIKVPPLIFLVFLENAFKHGISYTSDSFVSVSLSIDNDLILFRCMNSIHKDNADKDHEGIGLENVKRRLKIIYEKDYNLDINNTQSVYTVTLTLPPYETKDIDY